MIRGVEVRIERLISTTESETNYARTAETAPEPHSDSSQSLTDQSMLCYNSAESMDRCSASRQPADGFWRSFILSISYRKLVLFGEMD